jgi:RHS repeat-associated protein
VSQSEGGVVQRFVYDSMGRIVGEYATSPSAIRGEYIYLHPDAANDNPSPHGGDDGLGGYGLLTIMTPDASAGGAITAHYPHSNHLGAPLFSTDASGAVVTPGAYAQPVFPGQLRTRADLYYNRHRDYDPTTGRYIQADPLGLDGDANPYLYVNGNPMRYVDPTGEYAYALEPVLAGGAAEGGLAAFCTTNPVGWTVCGGAAAAVVVYSGYKLYKWYYRNCLEQAPTFEMAKKTKPSDKEKANDHPDWANDYEKDPNENCHAFAAAILNDKYGVGMWDKGAATEYNKIVKSCQRGTRWR